MIRSFLTVVSLIVSFGVASAQDSENTREIYVLSGGEMIFSFADITIDGAEHGSILRFSPFLNIQNIVNYDFSNRFGVFTGLSLRNVGFIYDQDDATRVKARTYNLGIPLGFKLGNMQKVFLYGGYEFEVPLHYKEKVFFNEDKSKRGIWFSDRTPIQHALLVGVQLPRGANLKFKYYLSDFYKKSYTESDGQGGTYRPYENFEANIFYFSLNFSLFRDARLNDGLYEL